MLKLTQLATGTLHDFPYAWGEINGLYLRQDAEALAATFPRDEFKRVKGGDGEKDYDYEARALIGMGASVVSARAGLSPAWVKLAEALLTSEYRAALSSLTGCDLSTAPLEVNVFHYGPGASLGPHLDLPDKIVTHVLYFNQSWNSTDGGCLSILRSSDPEDVFAAVRPIVGNSAILVRSDKSWHAVSRVVEGCNRSRRSLTATFYRHGSVSTMWPLDDATPLHHYEARDLELESIQRTSRLARWQHGLKRFLGTR